MNIPEDLKYTKTHEWVKIEDGIVICGISDYAQQELSDIVLIELPEIGQKVEKEKPMGNLEAVKAVSDIYAPVSGEIIEINEKLNNTPELMNKDPYGEGWTVKIKMSNPEELNKLLTKEEYEKLIEK